MIETAFFLFSLAVAAAFFIGSLILMSLGRRLGARYLAREKASVVVGLNAVEGAIFALMGLVLAFAISGALQRFDERKQLILQEANAITTAYDRLDLLPNEAARALKAKLKIYLEARLDLYKSGIGFSLWEGAEVASHDHTERLAKLKDEIWDGAVTACAAVDKGPACVLLLPSLNLVFDVARLRNGANERHPPQVIYVMLFGLGLGSSLLAGFGMAATKTRSWVHMITFAAALSLALFIVTDIEFPRLGLIRVDYFDHFMRAVHEQMR